MKLVKKLSSIVASIIIILAIGGYIFVRNFDLNRYKPYIEDIVFNATGRTLNMGGDAHLAISLVPTVIINDVSLSNASWAQNPNMAEMNKLEIKFAIMPLLKKQIVIDKLILHGTKVYLEKSETGEKNWLFDIKAQKTNKVKSVSSDVKTATEATVGTVLIAHNVIISDGILNYYDAKTKTNHLLEIENINTKLNGLDKPLMIAAKMKYNGDKIGIDASINTINSVINDDKLDFDAKIEALNVKADLSGSVVNVLSNPVYAIEGNIYNPKGNFSLPEINLITRIDGDNTSAGIELKKLLLAENEVTGKSDVDWSKDKPEVNIDLMSSSFNINDFISDKKQAFVIPTLIKSANALTFVPNDTINFSYLNMINGSINLKVDNLILPEKAELKNLAIKTKLQNGMLKMSPISVDMGEGKIMADVSVAVSTNSIKANIKAKDLKVQDIEKSLFDNASALKISQGGDLILDISLSSSGNTYRKLSENMDGNLVLILDKSTLSGADLNWLTNNIIGQLLSLLKIDTSKARNIDINCAVIRSDINKGKAYFPSGIAFNSDQIKMVGSGDINLVNDAISFTIAPTLNKLASGNITQALASFVKIEGTLDNPKLRLDTSSALSTIVGAVATGGISLGGEMLLSGDDDPCYSALVNTVYANKFKQTKGIKSSTKRAYQEVNKQAKNVIKDVGNAAKNIFDAFKEQF